MPETPGQYLNRLESDHDVLHLANQKIAALEAQLAALREAASAVTVYDNDYISSCTCTSCKGFRQNLIDELELYDA